MTEQKTNRPAPLKRKLIEVALPLEAINRESAREKSIRHGHPSTLHLWWARRPLAAARAVLFSQLVDDPSSRPDEFPTEEAQRAERERLHKLIERLVVWETSRDQALFEEAHQEILKSTGGHPPPILDPFAGGGTIPLEAQRLGLEAHASDLNPVAVLINKALIEIPPKFAGLPPVYPGLAGSKMDWAGATGLAADVRAYGEWMRDEALKRIGKHYPKATLPDGAAATVVAWIWARTVLCPNPACGIETPLVRSWWLRNKKGKEAWVKPTLAADHSHPSGKRVQFEIAQSNDGPARDGTMSGRQGATCVACGGPVAKDYIRSEGLSGRMGSALMATVAEGYRQRVYLAPTPEQVAAAAVARPAHVPDQELGHDPRNLWTPAYGLVHFCDLFTHRQLLALTTFSDLVMVVRQHAYEDARAAGLADAPTQAQEPTAATAYADAIATYLAMCISKLADRGSSLVTWFLGRESTRNTFSRQAIPMSWDYVEPNQFAAGTGSWSGAVSWTTEALGGAAEWGKPGVVTAEDASARDYAGTVISTDPPYYDNIGYASLSDFFYVWLRRSLRSVYPELFGTLLVPKAEELVADPYRHHGPKGARAFFEQGFRQVFARAREATLVEFPATAYYAFKQSDEGDDGTASTGWETLLDGMLRSGWEITATWPLRSELSNRMLSQGTNALASAIVLALRQRPEDAPTIDRRGLIQALHDELPEALRRLQQGAIAPVDLPQAAIGPGMAVFSRYSRVIEDDGSPMSVRSALARINEILDQVLNEQEGDYDTASRFAIAWYRQHGYRQGEFGAADNLARARNTSVDAVVREGIINSVAGRVKLIPATELTLDYDVSGDHHVGVWEVLHHLIARTENGGAPAAGAFLAEVRERRDGSVDSELVKELAFLLFHIAEGNGWTRDALLFNNVATSWPEIVDASRRAPAEVQLGLEIGLED